MKKHEFPYRLIRPASVIAILTLFSILSSCGYFYTSDIQGYIIDSESEEGINNARIYLYMKDPGNTPDPEVATDYFTTTSSATFNNNPGFFQNKVIWENSAGKFGSEGDTTILFAIIVHEDYKPIVATITGVLSDTTNRIQDIRLERATFSVDQIDARVIDSASNGVNGIRVILDLSPDNGNVDEDYIVNTQTIDGTVGSIRFTDVTWNNPDATDSIDEHEVLIVVSDTNYDATDIEITLTSGSNETVNDPIQVTRKPRTTFSTNVTGNLIERFNPGGGAPIEENPVVGVTVTLSYQSGAETKTMIAESDDNGTYTFFVQWEDTSPRSFDDENGAGAEDTSIPEGEDGLLIDLDFSDGSTPLEFDFDGTGPGAATSSITDRQTKSWIDPNRLPDGIR